MTEYTARLLTASLHRQAELSEAAVLFRAHGLSTDPAVTPSERRRGRVLARLHAYYLSTRRDGWKLWCDRRGYDPGGLADGFHGGLALDLVEALVADGGPALSATTLADVRAIRRETDPGGRSDDEVLTPEAVAADLDATYQLFLNQ